jgi:hypothetical protein
MRAAGNAGGGENFSAPNETQILVSEEFLFLLNLKYFEKSIAMNPAFDNFTAPRRPVRNAGQHVCEPITDSQQGQD